MDYNKVKGWLTGEEAEFLKEISRDKDVLEVGPYMGRSTVCIARTAKSVITIDTFKHEDNETGQTDSYTSIVPFLQNTLEFDNIITIIGKSVDVAKHIKDNSKDIIFIDGSHKYEDVKDDIRVWKPKLKKGGYMLFHDYYGGFTGVAKSVNEWKKPERVIGTIAVVKII